MAGIFDSGMFGGLLDMSDPQKLGSLISGASFLKAATPSMEPMNTAGRLGMAISDTVKGRNYQAKQTQDQQMGLLDLMGKQATIGQSMAKMNLLRQAMGFDNTQPGGNNAGQGAQIGQQAPTPPTSLWGSNDAAQAGGAASDGSAPGNGQQPSMPQGGGPAAVSPNNGGMPLTTSNPRLNALLGLSMMDGKLDTAYNMMKDQQTGYKRDAGAYYTDPVTGKQTYMPDPTKGLGLDPQGNVMAMPGYAAANAGIKGAEAIATKGAEARFSLLPQNYVNADGPNKGRPMGGSQFDYLFPSGLPDSPSAAPGLQRNPQAPSGMPADNGPGIQARIAYAQNIADPAERKSFINAVLTEANSMPNPAQRKYVTDTFNSGISNLAGQQSQQQSQQPMQQAQVGQSITGQPPVLQSAEEARNVSDAQDINKQRQLAQVNNQEGSFKGYKDELQKSVDTGYDLYRRNNMIRGLMKTYQTGLPNAEARTAFSSGLQNLFPGNDQVRSLAESINGGSVASAQTMAQVMSSATLKNLQEVLAGNGRINMAEVKQMQAHAESPSSDAGTLNNIMNYQDRFYNDSRKELGALTNAEKSGKLDPTTWRSDYIQTRHDNETTRSNFPTAPTSLTPPPQRAVANLKLNPKLADQFDAKYGAGSSARILRK